MPEERPRRNRSPGRRHLAPREAGPLSPLCWEGRGRPLPGDAPGSPWGGPGGSRGGRPDSGIARTWSEPWPHPSPAVKPWTGPSPLLAAGPHLLPGVEPSATGSLAAQYTDSERPVSKVNLATWRRHMKHHLWAADGKGRRSSEKTSMVTPRRLPGGGGTGAGGGKGVPGGGKGKGDSVSALYSWDRRRTV